MGWGQLFVAHLYPSVTVVSLGNGVGHEVNVFLNLFFFKFAADQALHCIQRIAWVGHGLALGRRTYQHFAIFLVGNDGRRGARALRVFNHFGGVALHDGHATVGGPQVDANDLAHELLLNQLNIEMCTSCGRL